MRVPLQLAGKRFGSLIARYTVNYGGRRKWYCECDCGKSTHVYGSALIHNQNTSCGCRSNAIKKLSWGGCGDITGNVWRRIIETAKKRKGVKGVFEITIQEAWKLYQEQNGKCKLSGLPLYLPKNGNEYHMNMRTASLDRIDSSKGYVIGNVQWLHKDVNRLKNDFSEAQFIMLCKQVANHSG